MCSGVVALGEWGGAAGEETHAPEELWHCHTYSGVDAGDGDGVGVGVGANTGPAGVGTGGGGEGGGAQQSELPHPPI